MLEGGKIAKRKYFKKAAKTYRKYGGNSLKPIIDGVVGGIAAEAGQKFIGAYGVPLGVGAAGYFLKNSTLKTIAGLHIGSIIGDMLPVIGGNGSAIGGVY